MTQTQMVEWVVATILIVVGISHILHAKLWSQFFTEVLQRPYAGLLVGMLTLPIGLIVLLGHSQWSSDVTVIVTIMGIAWTAKGLLYLLHPPVLKFAATRHVQHPSRFALAGVFLGALGLIVMGRLVINAVSPPMI
jgi:uncharacterized protein YjeT (DUF2065 family)